jgi:hypothetical protein
VRYRPVCDNPPVRLHWVIRLVRVYGKCDPIATGSFGVVSIVPVDCIGDNQNVRARLAYLVSFFRPQMPGCYCGTSSQKPSYP